MSLSCTRCRHEMDRCIDVPDDLPPDSWAARHRASCDACRLEWARLRSLSRDLLMSLRPEPSQADLPGAVWEGVALRQRAARPAVWRRPIWAAGALAVAVAVFAAQARWRSPRVAVHPLAPAIGPAAPAAASRDQDPIDPGRPEAGIHREHSPRVAKPMMARKSPMVAGPGVRIPPPAPVVPDERYLNGGDPSLARWWLVGHHPDRDLAALLGRPLPPMKDDFAQPPLPLLADADGKMVAEAVKQYAQEAKVVDTRLFWKVTLALKAASLEELCAELEKQTGVRLLAARGVADEKVTVFVDRRPEREVMREIARLFGYAWSRSGQEGAYRYELIQGLRAQLAEVEARQKDLDAALIALDDDLMAFRPFLGRAPAELEAAEQRAQGSAKARIRRYLEHRAPINVYHHMSPSDRAALLKGEMVRFIRDAVDADHRLPRDWYPFDGAADQQSSGGAGGPGARPFVGLSLDRSEVGELRLLVAEGGATEAGPDGPATWGGIISGVPLSVGKSPSTADPQNALANRELRGQPAFRRPVTFEAKPSCPAFTPEAIRKRSGVEPTAADEINRLGEVHVQSGDVWEAVHRATGLPIIADAYSRYYPAARFTCKETPLFEALCRSGDELGARWKKDGDYLLARSTGYFWDKLKEVPNRQLRRWHADLQQHGTLPVDAVLEMATLSDTQLDSDVSGRVIGHCWQLEEWGNVGRGLFRIGVVCTELRPFARFFAALSEPQRRLAETQGVGAADLRPAQAEALQRLLQAKGLSLGSRGRLRLDYAPAGTYVWEPSAGPAGPSAASVIWARTPEAALGVARRLDPAATAEQVHRRHGVFGVSLLVDNRAGWQLRYDGSD
jgi:hypothetical protein